MLTNVFIKTPEQKIMSLFTMNPGRAFYGREISRKLHLSAGSVHASLARLEKEGLLRSEWIGPIKIFSLMADLPVLTGFKILHSFMVLNPLVASLRESTRRIVLYGSHASGTFDAESDLDVFIVTEHKDNARKAVDGFMRKTGLDVRPIIKSQFEWMNLEKDSPEFFDELSHGLVLWEKTVDESGF
jgi:hypothetical protein